MWTWGQARVVDVEIWPRGAAVRPVRLQGDGLCKRTKTQYTKDVSDMRRRRGVLCAMSSRSGHCRGPRGLERAGGRDDDDVCVCVCALAEMGRAPAG